MHLKSAREAGGARKWNCIPPDSSRLVFLKINESNDKVSDKELWKFGAGICLVGRSCLDFNGKLAVQACLPLKYIFISCWSAQRSSIFHLPTVVFFPEEKSMVLGLLHLATFRFVCNNKPGSRKQNEKEHVIFVYIECQILLACWHWTTFEETDHATPWDTTRPYRNVHRLTWTRLHRARWPSHGSLVWQPTWGFQQLGLRNKFRIPAFLCCQILTTVLAHTHHI